MAGGISSAILVGRERNVDTLSAELDASAAGAPRFIVVLGEAGIGKSRLVREGTQSVPDESHGGAGDGALSRSRRSAARISANLVQPFLSVQGWPRSRSSLRP